VFTEDLNCHGQWSFSPPAESSRSDGFSKAHFVDD
jgi:hypothetical protein